MEYDVAVVGGGVVGCATLFELTNHGYRCVLLEKNPALVAEASCGNSGMLHTGFDAVGVELDCIKICQSKVFDITRKLGVPVNHIGATMVVWNEMQKASIQDVVARSRAAGVSAVQELSASQLYQREPHLVPGALGALAIPGEAVTDPWLLPTLLAHNVKQKGATILLNARMLSCTTGSHVSVVETTRGPVRARCVVNCGGLYGDVVDKLAVQQNFSIRPRKGQYTMYAKTAKGLINSSIIPVPTKVGKGIIVFRSIYDNVIVGPTSEDVESRQHADIDDQISKRLLTVTRQTVKALDRHDVVGMYTGVRPATEYKDYIIKANKERYWVTVGGIRSTGVSGCLGIAEKVRHLVEGELGVEPSRGRDSSLSKPDVLFTKFGTAVIDEMEYRITHPITLVGTQSSLFKL